MSKEPVAWVTPQDLIDMQANALIGTRDWSLVVGLVEQKGDVALYLYPPKKEWVGLTEEDKNDCLVSADPCECLAKPEASQLIEDVEDRLKEKNT